MNAHAISCKRLPARASARSGASRGASVRRVQQTRGVSAAAGPMEVAQLANEAAFISGVAGTMISMTLIGIALGFVLLRVESLVEEGKL